MAKPAVTSADVARLANVSQSAVSRTYTPGASVSEVTRKKVLQAAEQLGYRPNALARAVISGKSGLIAVLAAYLDNQFYPIVLEQLSRQLQDRGYQVLLFMTEPGRQDGVVEKILQYQVQGIVMASASLSSDLAEECARTGIPVVLFNRNVPDSPASSVTSDNFGGGRLVADHLISTGHQRIAYIAGAEDSSTNRDREAGFMAGLTQHGLSLFARGVGNYTHQGAAQAARDMFGQPEKPDAVFVANDHMAFAVMDVLRGELQLRVPDDVSIFGYDDVPQAAWQGYQLASVSQSPAQMIDKTVSILIEQASEAIVSRRAEVLPAKLVIRQSVRN